MTEHTDKERLDAAVRMLEIQQRCWSECRITALLSKNRECAEGEGGWFLQMFDEYWRLHAISFPPPRPEPKFRVGQVVMITTAGCPIILRKEPTWDGKSWRYNERREDSLRALTEEEI